MTVRDLQKLRAVLVTGKGGVGKTTMAAALAKRSAASGVRTLAVEIADDDDREAPLGTMLGVRTLREEPTLAAPNLHFAVLAPAIGHKAFLRDALPVRMLADAAMKSQAVRRFLHAAPTFPELGVLYRLLDLARARRSDGSLAYDHVIVDLPATGHALALVQVPGAVLRVVPGGTIGHAVRAGLELLCDPAQTGALVVTLPEPLPVSESLELVRGLEDSRVAVKGVVLNRVPEDPFTDGELEVALSLTGRRATLGARSVQRIARASGSRARRRNAAGAVRGRRARSRERRRRRDQRAARGGGLVTKRAQDTSTFLDPLVRTKRVIVCCGAGGVGKTTTSAALGVAGALVGRRTLVLTIDPARRLAEAMGIPAGSREPVTVDPARLGVSGGGSIDAWMLSPAVVFEDLVRRLAPDEERARVILSSRLYGHLTEVVAGMQEYTAAEALYTLSSSGKYDLIVLDTPPSRNALAFLEAPRKLSMFLDERVLGLFLPGAEKRGFMWNSAATVVRNVFVKVLGEQFWGELQEFLQRFSGMFDPMRSHAGSVRDLLRSDATSFVLVTSPEPAALREAAYFESRIRELELPMAGAVLNRSWAYTRGLDHPGRGGTSELEASALDKLRPLAIQELARADRDRKLLATLRERQRGKPAIATPHLAGSLDDLEGLTSLARHLVFGGDAQG